jgi:hypothetical protein
LELINIWLGRTAPGSDTYDKLELIKADALKDLKLYEVSKSIVERMAFRKCGALDIGTTSKEIDEVLAKA